MKCSAFESYSIFSHQNRQPICVSMPSNQFSIFLTWNTWKHSSTRVREEYDCYSKEKRTTINRIIIHMPIQCQYGIYIRNIIFWMFLLWFLCVFAVFMHVFAAKAIIFGLHNILHYHRMNSGVLPFHFRLRLASRVEKLSLKRDGQHGCCCYVVIQWRWSTVWIYV